MPRRKEPRTFTKVTVDLDDKVIDNVYPVTRLLRTKGFPRLGRGSLINIALRRLMNEYKEKGLEFLIEEVRAEVEK